MDSLAWTESSRQKVCSPVRMKRKFRSKRYEFVGWGSRPLIEFLESIGKDIREKISRHDVTSIINEYVKINSLLHPSRKKRILCDDRLYSIFGRKTIGRIKIYDLLEPHFAENQDDDDDFFYSSDETENPVKPLKRENGITPVKKLNQKTRVLVDPNSSFAAMVPGNINLVYLRKSLVEDLLNDPETFESKLIGSFVRIKSDPHDYLQKNTHQLVHVLGVKKNSIVGDLGTKFLLHVSNVMKDVTICMLSDEKFSEEECKDLDLRVKQGLVKKLTIAEVQQKVEVLHVDITKHWLSREILLLQNLIDQANEKGWRRELDQYLEKKQLLQTAEEQSRMLREIPQVIADETELKGIYVSANQGDNVTNEGDETKLQTRKEVSVDTNQGETVPSSNPNVDMYVAENRTTALMSNIKKFAESRQSVVDEERPPQPVESTYNNFNETEVMNEVERGWQANERTEEPRVINLNERTEEPRVINLNERTEEPRVINLNERTEEPRVINLNERIEEPRVINLNERTEEPRVINLSDDDEPEPPRTVEQDWNNKVRSLIWYYLDPQGNVQGPFCLVSLKNWKDAHYFPSDFKVWMMGQTPDQAILLSYILSIFFS